MIGRFFPGADKFIDLAFLQPVSDSRRQHQMVNPDAIVFLPGTGLIIPKRKDLVAIGLPHRIGQPQILQSEKC